jgi:mono/diheme cytochrome c family protein
MKVLASRLSAAGIAVLFATVPVAAAEPAIDQAQAAAGGVWYEKYCTPCHGSGGGPGSAVYSGSNEAVDLRRYVARHNGVFPAREWFDVVEQFDHKSPHADVWDKILRAQPNTITQRPAARGVVALIADYIVSIQSK